VDQFYDSQATTQFSTKVVALRRPSSYPERVERIQTIETHMSWVFLTDSLVYKLKKPVRTPVLDYTTVEARRRSCEAEFEVNRPLAESVYLGVVPLVASDDGLRVDAVGEPIDWLVKMRRLPDDLLLDRSVALDQVRPPAIDLVADKLTQFYATTEAAPFEASEYRSRIVADIESKCASLESPHYAMRRTEIHQAVAVLHNWLDEHADLLEARASSVVDAHGDLRPEHICLEPDPVIIDRLEFDRSLRLLDPVSELSFLALECRRLGANWIGRRLLANYLGKSPGEASSQLISFYEGYHAVVRAAVALWHLDDPSRDDAARWRRRARWYLQDVPCVLLALE
jgi:aminoglycoside phosphotransferase family enzyme